jgi:hypothetical protein
MSSLSAAETHTNTPHPLLFMELFPGVWKLKQTFIAFFEGFFSFFSTIRKIILNEIENDI